MKGVSAQGEEAAALTQRKLVLAEELVANLHDSTVDRSVRDLADKLFEKLLKAFPGLVWQPQLLSALLSALDAVGPTGSPVVADPRIHSWLRKVESSSISRGQGCLCCSFAEICTTYKSGEAIHKQTRRPVCLG